MLREIDPQVYALYGLTPEEIAIVAVRQTFNRVFNQWKACATEDVNGESVSLGELRDRYKKQRGI